MTKAPCLIVVAGATSVGKTDVCMKLARNFKTEIINCDSRQMFCEMPIGSGCPDEKDLKEIKHHFIGSHSVHDYYNAGRYEEDALKLIENLFTKHPFLVVSAGSGMYLDAITRGIDLMPEYNDEVRQQLNIRLQNEGVAALLKQLNEIDPVYFQEVDKNNTQRILRGLEVYMLTGKPYSSFRVKTEKIRNFAIVKIVLQRNREELYDRINSRVDRMIELGLEGEARQLYPFKSLVPLKTIGYREWFMHFDGQIDRDEAIRLIKRNTRHFARRQLTWFRSKPEFKELPADNFEEIIRYIYSFNV